MSPNDPWLIAANRVEKLNELVTAYSKGEYLTLDGIDSMLRRGSNMQADLDKARDEISRMNVKLASQFKAKHNSSSSDALLIARIEAAGEIVAAYAEAGYPDYGGTASPTAQMMAAAKEFLIEQFKPRKDST